MQRGSDGQRTIGGHTHRQGRIRRGVMTRVNRVDIEWGRLEGHYMDIRRCSRAF